MLKPSLQHDGLEDWDFGRLHSLMNGISSLTKGIPESSLALFLSCEDTRRSQQCAAQKRAAIRTRPCWSCSGLQNNEEKNSIFHAPSGLWFFVIAVKLDNLFSQSSVSSFLMCVIVSSCEFNLHFFIINDLEHILYAYICTYIFICLKIEMLHLFIWLFYSLYEKKFGPAHLFATSYTVTDHAWKRRN